MWTFWVDIIFPFLQKNKMIEKHQKQLSIVQKKIDILSHKATTDFFEKQPKHLRLADKAHFLSCAREKFRIEKEIQKCRILFEKQL